MKQVYKTRDGQTFEDGTKAREHENELFDVWLMGAAKRYTLQDLLEGLNRTEENEFFDTPRKVLIDLLRGYFETHEDCV
jgi:hypothetical protein